MSFVRAVVVTITFALGFLVGGTLQPRIVGAQAEPPKEGWVLEPVKENAHFDAYLYNANTGEVFMLETRHKTKVEQAK